MRLKRCLPRADRDNGFSVSEAGGVRTVTSQKNNLATGLAIFLSVVTVVILMSGCSERSPLVPVTYVETSSFTSTSSGTSTITSSGTQTIDTTSGVDSTIPTTVTSAGTANTFDLNSFIYDSSSGSGVANVSVTTSAGHSVKTLSDGRFYLRSVSPGTFTISLSAIDYEDFSYAVEVATSGRIYPGLGARIERKTYPLSGKVLTKGTTSEPIVGAHLRIKKLDDSIATTSTTSNGEFLFPAVTSGRYTLEAWQGKATIPEQSVSVFIDKNGSITPAVITILLKPTNFKLQGFVKLDSTKEPLSGIDLSISQNGTFTASTTTTSEGKFTFSGLPAGLLTIQASESGFLNATAVVQIFEDGTISPPTPEIPLSREISSSTWSVYSRLLDAYSAAPLEFVTITLKGYASTITDRNGYFYVDNLPPGQYSFECRKEGFNQFDGNFMIYSTGSSTINKLYYMVFSLETGLGSVVGRYISTANKFASGFPVAIYAIHDLNKDKERRLWALTLPKTPIKETYTGSNLTRSDNESDETGIFKFTHLQPTTENSKYLIVVGENYSTKPKETVESFTLLETNEETKEKETIPYSEEVLSKPDSDLQFYFIVDVAAGKTSFVTNNETIASDSYFK